MFALIYPMSLKSFESHAIAVTQFKRTCEGYANANPQMVLEGRVSKSLRTVLALKLSLT
jgi:hypothetical protein